MATGTGHGADAAVAERLATEVLVGGDLDALEELVTTDVEIRAVGEEGAIEGREAYREHLAGLRAAFVDLEVETEVLAEAGEWAVVQWAATGTSEGPFMGLEPTGEAVSYAGIDAYRFRDGRVAELRSAFDMLGLLTQLDAVEPPWG